MSMYAVESLYLVVGAVLVVMSACVGVGAALWLLG